MAAIPLNQHSSVPDHIDRKCATWVQHATIAGRKLTGTAAGGSDLYSFGTRQTRAFHIWEFDMAPLATGWEILGPNTWVVRVNITAINAMSGVERCWICKADAAGVSTGTLGTWSGSTSGTGVKTLNVLNVAAWTPTSDNEHFYIVLGARASASGFPSITITNDQDNDCWISPIVQGGGPLIDRKPIGGGLIGGKLAWRAPTLAVPPWIERLAA